MPKATKAKCYAVRVGREGPKIYDTWAETEQNVSRFPGAAHKSFPLSQRKEAEAWINIQPATQHSFPKHPFHRDIPTTETISTNFTLDSTCQDDVGNIQSVHDPIPLFYEDVTPSMHKSSETILFDPLPGPAIGAPPLFDPLPGPAIGAPPLFDALSGPVVGIPPPPNVCLSKEQQDVLDMVRSGMNVFFTGSAGTGKSVLLQEIIRHCWGRGRKLAVTASTGIASVNIDGCTIHSWAGIGLGKEVKEMLVCRLIGGHKWTEEKEARELALKDGVSYFADPSDDSWLGNSPAMRRWIITKTLIIDEISMIDGELFDKLDFIARIIRRNDKPFGGIQLVLSGDFCQLPPVPDKLPNGEKKKVTFAFESQSWKRCIGRPVILTKVFRQKDQDFIDMLNAMRYGHVSKDTDVKFKHLARTVVYEDGIEPSELFPKRDQVDNANSKRLESLCTPAKAYNAIDTPGIDERGYPVTQFKMDDLLKPLVAKEQIVLKVGAQVMLIKNLVQGELVNGSVGIVVGFSTCREADRAGTQIAQFDSVENDPNEGGLQENIQQLTRLDRILMRRNEHYPVVRFQNGWRVLCIPATFEVNNLNSTVAASREQVPLILAWALSIHKSQGQTLERVRVNLRSTFEKGQAYVALSRATSMETLQVLNFNSTCVMAHERVLTWMREQTDDSTSNTP